MQIGLCLYLHSTPLTLFKTVNLLCAAQQQVKVETEQGGEQTVQGCCHHQ